jgi:pentatricopeptide repeat protein
MATSLFEHDFLHAIVELYEDMEKERAIPNRAIFLHILKACGSMGALSRGRLIHGQIIKNGLQTDSLIGGTLVDMYSNCGNLEDLERVFFGLPTRDIISWGALIAGYAEIGNYFLAAQCLENMIQEGLRPDDVIYTSILTACSHAGLLDEACSQFKIMIRNHGVTPNSTHYNCLIDLLGRLGCLDEAEDLLCTMPNIPDIVCWKSLLMSCKLHSNIELGRHCLNAAVQSDPHDSSGYVLMSSIYADLDMCENIDIDPRIS